MKRQSIAVVLVACAGSLFVACKAREESSRAAPEPAMAVAVPATPTASAAPAPSAPAPSATTPEAPPASPKPKVAPAQATAQPQGQPPGPPAKAAAPTSPPPVVAASTPPPAAAPPPAPPTAVPSAASAVADPGGEVGVPPAKAGLTRIGAEKCKLCHKPQYASWATSAHAKRVPPLECESCHGPGSEYKSLAVMKDAAAAKAAGLVKPDISFCGTCHKGKLDPGMLGKAHAHKAIS